ncbi:MAG: hypothetical protein OXB98_15275 [Bryobacterales bacterium]|nr:hypothetical protein [Bryobacterales bacterium]
MTHRVRRHGLLFVPLAVLTLFVGDTAAARGSVSDDREALVALYNATDGENWKTDTNWLSEHRLSEWQGVTTDKNGRVTQLTLINNRLSGEIPAVLANLVKLEALMLNRNGQLTRPLPVGLRDLSRLTRLWTSGTQVCAPRDAAFQAWLSTIDFSGVNCASESESVIGKDTTETTGGALPAEAVRRIEELLGKKARRTPAQRKMGSQLLDALRKVRGQSAANEMVTVDILTEVTPAVLARIRDLGGVVINNVPRYRAIRARLPLAVVETLATLDEVRSISVADESATRDLPTHLPSDNRTDATGNGAAGTDGRGRQGHGTDRNRP